MYNLMQQPYTESYEYWGQRVVSDTVHHVHIFALFIWLISHHAALLFSQNKPATNNQPAVLFSQNKSAATISHQPNEQATSLSLEKF
jgi:hypothetical protein